MATIETSYRQVGEGQNVVEHEAVEGPTLWLETPDDVIEFVTGDNVEDTIVISRGGSTTFVAPALTAGVFLLGKSPRRSAPPISQAGYIFSAATNSAVPAAIVTRGA